MSERTVLGAHMEEELVSQPEMWRRAVAQQQRENLLPAKGAKVAVVGCGTSWFMAEAYAAAREAAGHGVTDAFAASEARIATRDYDAVVAITRSGTTSEVLQLLAELDDSIHTVGIIGDVASPIVDRVDAVIQLPYADEQSVVQTRFATTALAYLLSSVGEKLDHAMTQAEALVNSPTPQELVDAEQFTFLGRGFSVGLAHEAALKMREAVQGWTEAYPAMDYRHGPIAIAAPNRVTWMLGEQPEDLDIQVRSTGAIYINEDRHPLAELAYIHRVTLDRARARGMDPDHPRNLTRSVILEG
ncbi:MULTISPECIES: SIS domain-containing protein [Micrococcaceae]|uniref:SIS domain-containing protein n=1 Tax=Micrococcaceae TaxID=1268 RepID=UPI000CFE11FA|nr:MULTISPECIES: SIS domain-containing protein [unclassified Arthrobacter]PQZ88289.1 sugar isomerase [Arthrobacter sp. MYb222]PRB76831.1 sugar isomerase [Arthrobacter sp. MYb214]TDU30291.1 SIS domain-containing protein [Arthrobacter sp. JUb115]